jgi:hypothetical protein
VYHTTTCCDATDLNTKFVTDPTALGITSQTYDGNVKFSINKHLEYPENFLDTTSVLKEWLTSAFKTGGEALVHNAAKGVLPSDVCVNGASSVWDVCLLKMVEREVWCVGGPSDWTNFDTSSGSGAYCGYYYQDTKDCGCTSYDGASYYDNMYTIAHGKLRMRNNKVVLESETGTWTTVYKWTKSDGEERFFLEEIRFPKGVPTVARFSYHKLGGDAGHIGKNGYNYVLEYTRNFDRGEHNTYAFKSQYTWNAKYFYYEPSLPALWPSQKKFIDPSQA